MIKRGNGNREMANFEFENLAIFPQKRRCQNETLFSPRPRNTLRRTERVSSRLSRVFFRRCMSSLASCCPLSLAGGSLASPSRARRHAKSSKCLQSFSKKCQPHRCRTDATRCASTSAGVDAGVLQQRGALYEVRATPRRVMTNQIHSPESHLCCVCASERLLSS
jgi:hypothetical protein